MTGMLVDGIDGTPYVAATLRLSETNGAQVEVPYLDFPGESQFGSTAEWFNSEEPPSNLLLMSLDGDISLYGCRYSGHTVNYPRGIGVGRVTPSELVLHGRDGDFHDQLEVKEFRSRIDGLIDWTRYGSIRRKTDQDDQGRVQRVTIEIASLDGSQWRQGASMMKISGDWNVDPARNSVNVTEGVSLVSTFECPKPVLQHLAEHRKVSALLSFIFGCATYFRRHDIKDSRFNAKTLDGSVVETPFYQLVSRGTVKEHSKPSPSRKRLQSPLVEFSKVGSNGLENWSTCYDTWVRFIHPAVSALNRPGAIIENLVISAAMSMEAAANLIGPVDGESPTCRRNGSPTTATYMYRCLVETGWDWSALCSSVVGLAQAIANNYNTIKHFDRGQFPDPTETHLVSSVTALAVRMLALRVTRPDLEAVDLFGNRVHDFDRLKDEFDAYGLFVNGDGQFVSRHA
ncbi:hypothetical protein IF129_16415 [Streptomyces chumphonensis]|uniref:ApeA N-terminal domain-containing protein n=1 Tax=Streptomyces chumphonensis TaxID=1214925 RepID=A0A927F0X6_9ACTN|nr:hypothetical protein [Streptomyces chumphonensis]